MSAHVWFMPALMSMTSGNTPQGPGVAVGTFVGVGVRVAVGVGVNVSVAGTVGVGVTGQQDEAAPAIAAPPTGAQTRTAMFRFVVLPSPSWPNVFRPQHSPMPD
jgi:hypothetical protein